MATINIFGDSQREQWHSVVNMLRQLGGSLDLEGRSTLCDELDRYIDAMEDLNEQEDAQDAKNGMTPEDWDSLGYKYCGLSHGKAVWKKRVFALIHKTYCETELFVDLKLFETIEQARDELRRQYDVTLRTWNFDMEQQDEFHNCECADDRARINDYTDFAAWTIEEKVVEL